MPTKPRALQQFDYAAIRMIIADLLSSPSVRHRAAVVLGQMQTALNANGRDETAVTLTSLQQGDARASVCAECVYRRGICFGAVFSYGMILPAAASLLPCIRFGSRHSLPLPMRWHLLPRICC